MTSLNCSFSVVGMGGVRNPAPSARKPAALHRLAAVRSQMGISPHSMARRLGISIADLKSQEEAGADLPLAVLYQWRDALGVPLSELLEEPEAPLSPPIAFRSQMLRLMKTVLLLKPQPAPTETQRTIQTLIDQMIELMPELRKVSAWQGVSRGRRRTDLGQAALRGISEDFFLE